MKKLFALSVLCGLLGFAVGCGEKPLPPPDQSQVRPSDQSEAAAIEKANREARPENQ